MTYPNTRDCEHGRQRGKCPECEVNEFLNLTQKLELENARLRGIIDRTRSALRIGMVLFAKEILNETK